MIPGVLRTRDAGEQRPRVGETVGHAITCPARQPRHEGDWPVLYVPAEQFVHVVAPAELNVPAGHAKQLGAPVALAYRPAGHTVQATEPPGSDMRWS